MRVVAMALVLAGVGLCRPAHADDDRTRARMAYDRGAAAFESGDFETAVRELTAADELVPSPTALAMALRSALRGDFPIASLELADRAERTTDPEVTSLAQEARRRYASRAGRLRVRCQGECTLAVDGRPLEPGKRQWLMPGSHELRADLGDEPERILHPKISAGDLTDMDLAPKPVAPKPMPKREHGLSPTWFWVGVGVTTVAAGATVWSGLDTNRRYDDFATTRTDPSLRDDGRAAETRTNVLLGVTAGAAIATAALGLFVVDFSSDSSKQGSLWVSPSGVRGTF